MKHDEHRELDISDPSTIAQIQIRFQLNAKVTPTRNLTLQLVPYIKYLTMQLSQDHHDIISNYSNCISQLSTNLKNWIDWLIPYAINLLSSYGKQWN